MAPNIVTSTDTDGKIIYKKPAQHSNIKEHNLEDVANHNIDNKSAPKDYSKMLPAEIGTDWSFKREIVWFNAIGFLILHLAAIYGFYLGFTSAHILTSLWSLAISFASGEGVTIGAHRMYSHKAFRGHFLTRLALVILHTIAGQNCMYIWVRDHRQHHKYSDTDADPHNATRGFFFSHIGWLMSRKHPAVIAKGKSIDMSDLEADPIIMIQKIFYKPLYLVFAVALPVAIPVYFWGENYWNSFFVAYMARYILELNITWLVNSGAHAWGNKPYDKDMLPGESKIVGYLAFGEGWHNYHHAFPWDYRAAELGIRYSPTTMIIDILAFLGLATDLKTTSDSLIKKRSLRTGDGTHPLYSKGVLKEMDVADEGDIDLKGRVTNYDSNDNLDTEEVKLVERGY
ncbi:(11Z)-hexadec-11-enoyl-CoA conjugase-like [Chrysoperla carnea]|uniref:(11Z)-hexadec-11-enoyl-CoA conjugase-like n=1 Tax=Chrysoperla carnea TaxID=189513 RepID=UPI001D05EC87|nr:(11Z)-hexadec-11-enoyl-CoA conjugase-like [Chrysoperla carnea]